MKEIKYYDRPGNTLTVGKDTENEQVVEASGTAEVNDDIAKALVTSPSVDVRYTDEKDYEALEAELNEEPQKEEPQKEEAQRQQQSGTPTRVSTPQRPPTPEETAAKKKETAKKEGES